MHTNRFFPLSGAPFQALLGAAFALYACSFQNFDDLQNGPAAEGGGGSGGSQGQTGGRAESGGANAGGATGGKPSQGGSSGSSGAPAGGDAGAGGDGNGQGGEGGGVVGGAGGQGAGPGQGGVGGDPNGGTGGEVMPPEPVGNLLANPSFESGLTGWTVDPASSAVLPTRYVYTQPPSSGSTSVDGAVVLATWNLTAEYTLSVYQVVKNLRPGVYSFQGNFATQRTQGASLFARNCGGADRMVVIPVSAGFEWFNVAIPDIEVSASSCEVGFTIHNVGDDWVNADMLTFEKVP